MKLILQVQVFLMILAATACGHNSKYGIKSIPTQVFLNETGKEYYRHVGFFPEEELVKVLQMKGVKMN